jgi:hypothetical protein
MTRKPRSTYPDRTRATRAARRQAILNAAAQRMGVESWSTVEARTRWALETAATDHGAAAQLRELLLGLADKIIDGPADRPPADVQAVRDRFPLLDNHGNVTDQPQNKKRS